MNNDILTLQFLETQGGESVRAILFEIDEATGARNVRDIMEFDYVLDNLEDTLRSIGSIFNRDNVELDSEVVKRVDFGKAKTFASRCVKFGLQMYNEHIDELYGTPVENNRTSVQTLVGKTIAEVKVDGYLITFVFTDGTTMSANGAGTYDNEGNFFEEVS